MGFEFVKGTNRPCTSILTTFAGFDATRRFPAAHLAKSPTSRRSKSSVWRIPEQASKNVRPHTVKRLAEALGVEIERLVEQPHMPGFKTTRISATLFPGVRLAYDLIERRYGLGAGHLINMAPLFFTLLAEGSLRWRQARLDEMLEAVDRVRALGDDRRRCAWHAGNAQNDSWYEQEAIDRSDLFNDPYPHDYDFSPDEDWDGSPFADYLRKLSEAVGKPDLADLASPGINCVVGVSGVPTYSVLRGDFNELAASGSRAAHALHATDVRLSDIPEELLGQESQGRRTAWLEASLSPESKEWLDEVDALLESF